MPKLIGEFITDLAQKAGVASDNEHLKSLLASPELINVKVPDELITSLDQGLINITEAQNNHPVVKKKYFKDAYDGMDTYLVDLLESDDLLTDEAKAEIKAEKSTTKKMDMAFKKLKEAKGKASPEDKAAINKQLAELHETLRLQKEATNKQKEEYEGKIKSIHLDSALNSILANYKTIYDDLPQGVKSTSLKAMITQALQDNTAELKVDDNGALQLVGKDGSNVFGSDHRPLTPQSFLNKTFAPILKVSGTKPVQTPITPATPPGDATSGFLQSHNQQVLAEMSQAKAPMI